MTKLADKAVLITGASRGLGRALAEELAGRGARVGLVARDGRALAEVVGAIRAKGGDAHAIPGDVADKEATHRIAGAAAALLGPVELLVNNASTLGPSPLVPLLDTECESLSRAVDVNLVGPFRLAKAVAGSMALRGRGAILWISSDAAVEAYPGWGAYGATKAAADHLARVWAAELRDLGVTVASLDPGEMDTAMHAEALPDADRSALARPSDVARWVVEAWESGHVTSGARLVVPGRAS